GTFTATVTDGSGGTPAGSVNFLDGPTILGTGTLNGTGQAFFTTSSLAPGAHSITAVYGGSGNFSGSTSPAITQIVNPVADLSITKTASPNGNVATSSQITYTITVNNAGPDVASSVNLDDATPTGTTFSSVNTSHGSCTAPSLGSSGNVHCTLGTINPSSPVTITLKVDVTALPGASINNTANVSSSTFDPNSTNNSASTSNAVSGCDLVVMNTNDSGAHSLRLAIQCANANPGLDTITFNIPGGAIHTIQPATSLPSITDPVIIDGYTQPGASANILATSDNAILLVEINGSSTGGLGIGLNISSSGGGSTLRGLAIYRFGGSAISVNAGGNHLEGNFINMSATGTVAMGGAGIAINGANNVVGGTSPAQRNLISGSNSSSGISINGAGSTGNLVQGNFIGTGMGGNFAMPNAINGISLSGGATNNTIGGTASGAGNVISGNANSGILIISSGGNGVQCSFVGM